MMLRALGRLALPVLLGLWPATVNGGPISVAENPAEASGASSLYGNVIVRIASGSFQDNNPADQDIPGAEIGGAPMPGGSLPTALDASPPLPAADLQLAGNTVITMGQSTIEIQYYTVAGEPPVGMDDPDAAPNPEPAGIALFCIGGIGIAGYAWRVRQQSRLT
jgi:hypothetical protein